MSQREAAKAERRARIVQAAARLVRAVGFDRVSMTDIAAEAGVSPATLYNLFQAKGAIFRAVWDLDLIDYRRRVEAAPARDALDRLFVAVELAAGLYAAQPDFYRAMARTVAGTEPLGHAINAPRTAFWRDGVAEAVREGALLPEAEGLLGEALTHLFRGVFLHWAAGEIDVARLEAEIVYGFALMLLAYAAPAQIDGLRACIKTLEPVLRSTP
jgi:AcrR family transcriptional regulator